MSSPAPPWLLEMRALTGTTEVSGTGNNPRILAMADFIGRAYPDMAAYADSYREDETPWCGLCAAYVMARNGIRPVWGDEDTDKWLWAQAWGDPLWGHVMTQPRLGCVVVLTREGGGHVTLFESFNGDDHYNCRGGNQSDAVNVKSFPVSDVLALVWPRAGGPIPAAPRPELEQGSSGSDVAYLQDALALPIDGEFGAITDAAVKGFQCATGLYEDGVVGPATWEKIDVLVERRAKGDDGLPTRLKEQIITLAYSHPLQDHDWADRGSSPPGYVAGMGQAYALAVSWWQSRHPAALEMAQAASHSGEDVLEVYGVEFDKLDMNNSRSGLDTLRHLFAFMIGLGMRESSGEYFTGRDQNATNVESDTCEAGLFQASWNIRSASKNIPPLLEVFWADPNGFVETFSVELEPMPADLENYGSGQGAAYQFLAKYCPAFAVFVTALGLRKRCSHWGPVQRHEVELTAAADDFLQEVDALLRG